MKPPNETLLLEVWEGESETRAKGSQGVDKGALISDSKILITGVNLL